VEPWERVAPRHATNLVELAALLDREDIMRQILQHEPGLVFDEDFGVELYDMAAPKARYLFGF